jgi:hypothetical protein
MKSYDEDKHTNRSGRSNRSAVEESRSVMHTVNNESFKKEFELKNANSNMSALYSAFGARTGRRDQ